MKLFLAASESVPSASPAPRPANDNIPRLQLLINYATKLYITTQYWHVDPCHMFIHTSCVFDIYTEKNNYANRADICNKSSTLALPDIHSTLTINDI